MRCNVLNSFSNHFNGFRLSVSTNAFQLRQRVQGAASRCFSAVGNCFASVIGRVFPNLARKVEYKANGKTITLLLEEGKEADEGFNCPITADTIRFPLRTRCKHHFEEADINRYAKDYVKNHPTSRTFPCPCCRTPLPKGEPGVPDLGFQRRIIASLKGE